MAAFDHITAEWRSSAWTSFSYFKHPFPCLRSAKAARLGIGWLLSSDQACLDQLWVPCLHRKLQPAGHCRATLVRFTKTLCLLAGLDLFEFKAPLARALLGRLVSRAHASCSEWLAHSFVDPMREVAAYFCEVRRSRCWSCLSSWRLVQLIVLIRDFGLHMASFRFGLLWSSSQATWAWFAFARGLSEGSWRLLGVSRAC